MLWMQEQSMLRTSLFDRVSSHKCATQNVRLVAYSSKKGGIWRLYHDNAKLSVTKYPYGGMIPSSSSAK